MECDRLAPRWQLWGCRKLHLQLGMMEKVQNMLWGRVTDEGAALTAQGVCKACMVVTSGQMSGIASPGPTPHPPIPRCSLSENWN